MRSIALIVNLNDDKTWHFLLRFPPEVYVTNDGQDVWYLVFYYSFLFNVRQILTYIFYFSGVFIVRMLLSEMMNLRCVLYHNIFILDLIWWNHMAFPFAVSTRSSLMMARIVWLNKNTTYVLNIYILNANKFFFLHFQRLNFKSFI